MGERTKSARYGHGRDHFEPGDTVWFWSMYNWTDSKMVIKDGDGEYMVIDEEDIKAFEVSQ